MSGLSVVMTQQYVHKYKMILRKTKVLKEQFLVTKTEWHFKKVVRCTNQSTVLKVATKLQNGSQEIFYTVI